MQEKSPRRSNPERSKETRAALIKAARKLFINIGYAETGTPQIVDAAQVTRGALYHHFIDKRDLFRAVVISEAQAVADKIDLEAGITLNQFDALMAGCEAYFAAMAVAGRTRLLLIDGPSVLGNEEMERINTQTAGQKLHQGLTFALETRNLPNSLLEPLTQMLSACFDKAALAIAHGKSTRDYQAAIRILLEQFR
ncbi:MAG: TetR/AcrR family transcriptional regulator [Devosiaceae bacterium]|nr:TetR/AcrR family transcriptional regulator [Devosiaceae bacterium]